MPPPPQMQPTMLTMAPTHQTMQSHQPQQTYNRMPTYNNYPSVHQQPQNDKGEIYG